MPNVKRTASRSTRTAPIDGGQLLMRFGRFGAFVACSNYPECKYTRNVEEPAAPDGERRGGG